MTFTALQPLGNHLWQSTLFAVVAGLLTLTLRKNRAQVRYWLWFAASIKFLVPFAILVTAGEHFGVRTASTIAPSGLPLAIERAGAPFAVSVAASTMPAARHSASSFFPVIFYVVWAIGFVTLAFRWWLRWRSIRAALRTASPLDLPIDLKVMTSPEFGQPGVFGIRCPVLLLPEGIASRLTPPQLEAILAHELCHVARRDNLATAIHMAVEAVFWFHPLVWWLGARLMDERERACDEEVLRSGSEPQVYAEGILRICELYLESPLRCVAGVTGGSLKRRIEEIMIGRIVVKLNFAMKAALAVAGAAAVTAPILVGILNTPAVRAQSAAENVPKWQTAAGGKMAFEVSSVKLRAPGAQFTPPNFPLSSEEGYSATGGRFFADFPLRVYITFAYKLSLTESQVQSMVAQLPKWVSDDKFIIQAKAASSNPTKDQMRLMVQALLADRFQLAIHFETRDVRVLALTLMKPGKTGPKLIPHAAGPPCDAPVSADLFPRRCEVTSRQRMPSGVIFGGSRNTTMELIADDLPSLANLDRPVVDQTGLSGKFDYRIEWTPEPNVPLTPNADVQPDLQGTTFLQALNDQLGLKLKSTVGPVRTLVIDHIERPSEN